MNNYKDRKRKKGSQKLNYTYPYIRNSSKCSFHYFKKKARTPLPWVLALKLINYAESIKSCCNFTKVVIAFFSIIIRVNHIGNFTYIAYLEINIIYQIYLLNC